MTKQYSRKRSDMFWGFLMIAPLTIGLGVFYFYPFVRVFFDSFFEVGAFNKSKFAGLANYQTMFGDPAVWHSLGNTLLYVLIIVPVTIVLALLIAVLLNTGIRGRGTFRVIYFIPTITMSAAVAMVWSWIYNGDFGILNYLLTLIGLQPVQWLSSSGTVLLAVSMVAIWMNTGYNMIILLAGIQGISHSYYEAAAIDGAGGLKQFTNVTLPLVTPTLFFVLVTTLISTFQTFDVIYMMVKPTSLAIESAQSLVVYFYRNAFTFSKKGYASAIAILLFAIIMMITAVQMWGQKKWVNYD